jgi:tRNA(fMet)-specific endonuclease VapC
VKYLLDTNVFSAMLLPQVEEAKLQKYEALKADSATASLVLHELRYGADLLPARSRRRAAILEFVRTQVETMPVLAYEIQAAEWHATERARLRRRGRTPPFADGQMAAIAAVNDLTIVTDNSRDFGGFQGLRIEHW